jgi:hypothetical protein
MAKTLSEKVAEMQAQLNKIEIERGINAGINKWIRTICITATCSVLSFFAWLGNFVHNNFEAVYQAAKAFLSHWGSK